MESEQRELNERELIVAAYQNLCHDDPLPISAKSCAALQAALLDPKQPFALSRRLLHGIDQCAKRESESLDQSSSSSFVETIESKRESYGWLAWTAQVSIPLKCIKAKTLIEVSNMLGSLLDRSQEQQCETTDQGATTINNVRNNDVNGFAANGKLNDEFEEVFADESDGSDFEFESSYDPAAQVSELTAWSVAVGVAWDPLSLSRVPPSANWEAVALVVTAILQECRYNAFSEISPLQWNKHRLSEQLTQLALGLLVPEQNKTPIFKATSVETEHWQRLGVVVLHVFRDAYAQNESILEDYLGLIRILVQLDRASKEGEINTATLAGVGALSALCDDALSKRQNAGLLSRAKASILDACDDLSLLLEKSGSNGTMELTILPLFEVLTADASGSGDTAQVLLNSGLFRQWLLRWSEQESPATKEMVNVSILNLCFYSSALLGKYAWRFQGLATESTEIPCEDEDLPLINSFCWNLLGIHLSTSNGPTTVQWKSKNPSPTIPTKDVCMSQSLQLYKRMCDNATRILTDWKLRRQNTIPNPSVKQKRAVLEDLLVLSNRLEYTLLRKLLLHDLSTSKQELSQMLAPLQTLLVQWPATTTRRERSEEKEDEADETQQLQRSLIEEDAIVAGLRKATKTILSTFESAATPSDHTGSFSSKAD